MYPLLNEVDVDEVMVDDHDVPDVLDDRHLYDELEQHVLDDDEHEQVLNDIYELIDVLQVLVFDEIDEHDIAEYVM